MPRKRSAKSKPSRSPSEPKKPDDLDQRQRAAWAAVPDDAAFPEPTKEEMIQFIEGQLKARNVAKARAGFVGAPPKSKNAQNIPDFKPVSYPTRLKDLKPSGVELGDWLLSIVVFAERARWRANLFLNEFPQAEHDDKALFVQLDKARRVLSNVSRFASASRVQRREFRERVYSIAQNADDLSREIGDALDIFRHPATVLGGPRREFERQFILGMATVWARFVKVPGLGLTGPFQTFVATAWKELGLPAKTTEAERTFRKYVQSVLNEERKLGSWTKIWPKPK